MDLGQFEDHVDLARQMLAKGEPRQAALILSVAASAHGLEFDEARLGTLFDEVAEVGEGLKYGSLADAAREAHGGSAESLFQLGYKLVEVGLPQIAIPVLKRVDAVHSGGSEVVLELCAAYEAAGHSRAVVDLLQRRPSLLRQFWFRYLTCFHAIQLGDLDLARRHAPYLEGEGTSERVAAARIRGMLYRADAVLAWTSLDPMDLRGWHYVLNGSVLLHLSPWGFEDGMHGRYAYLVDDLAEIRMQLDRIVAVFQHTASLPTCIVLAEDRGSQIIGRALATLLDLPIGDPQEGGLFVVYELGEGQEPKVPDGCRCFARAARWTHPPTTVPDYLGLLHQFLEAPWDGPDVEGVSDAVWIRRIVDVEPMAPEVVGDMELWDPLETVLALAQLSATPSDRWVDGPVVSGRFH